MVTAVVWSWLSKVDVTNVNSGATDSLVSWDRKIYTEETKIALKQNFLTLDNLKGILHEKLMKTSPAVRVLLFAVQRYMLLLEITWRYSDRRAEDVGNHSKWWMTLWASSHISLPILIINYSFSPHFLPIHPRSVMTINIWEKKVLMCWKFLVNFKIPVVARLVFGRGQSSELHLSMAATLLSSAGFIWRSWSELNLTTKATHSCCIFKCLCS